MSDYAKNVHIFYNGKELDLVHNLTEYIVNKYIRRIPENIIKLSVMV